MEENSPLVSIIIPLYNAEKYVSETLNSVINQTYNNWECIIVNDGSTDMSEKVVTNYCKKDSRFKYYIQTNQGASAARNTGTQYAKGDYIQYLDADDAILSSKIDEMIKAYETEEQKTILYSGLTFVSENDLGKEIPSNFNFDIGRKVNFKDIYRYYPRKLSITPTCVLFKKEHISHALWDVEFGPCEDWDYLLQLTYKGFLLKYYPKKLVLYRNSTGSHSKQIENSQKSNFGVLFKWFLVNNRLVHAYIRRNVILLNNSFFRFLTSKTKRVTLPPFRFTKKRIGHFIFYLIIYLIAFLSIVISLIKITIRRFSK